jgi:hypothetical protein
MLEHGPTLKQFHKSGVDKGQSFPSKQMIATSKSQHFVHNGCQSVHGFVPHASLQCRTVSMRRPSLIMMDKAVHLGRSLASCSTFVHGRPVRSFQRSRVHQIFKWIYHYLAAVVGRAVIKLVVVLFGPAIASKETCPT